MVELLDHLGASGLTWSVAEVISLARARGHAGVDADIEATLARIWELAFIEEKVNTGPGADALLWERRGWKLPLQYLVSALTRSTSAVKSVASPGFATGARSLPPPDTQPELGLDEALGRRRTCRAFSGAALELSVLSALLAHGFRPGSSPLPGQLTVHLVVMRIAGLEPGVYSYEPGTHSVAPGRRASAEVLEPELVRALIGQTYVVGSAVAVLLSGRLDALSAERPGASTLRAWLIEVGMLCQRLLLGGHTYAIDSFLSAALLEHELRALTGGDLDGETVPIHLVAFGVGSSVAGP